MTELITADLDSVFRSLRDRDKSKISPRILSKQPDYKRIPNNNYAPSGIANTGSWGNGMTRTASGNSGMI